MSTDRHPELADLLAGGEDASIEPCSPGCPLPTAHRLWPAWRDLDIWRARVDAELPGEMGRLLPELWQMWNSQELPEEAAAPGASSLDGAIGDRLSDEEMALLMEDLYRAVFALGAAWAQGRDRSP